MKKIVRTYVCPLCGRVVETDGTEQNPPYCCHEPMMLEKEEEVEEEE